MCLIRVGAKLCRDTGPPGSTFPTPGVGENKKDLKRTEQHFSATDESAYNLEAAPPLSNKLVGQLTEVQTVAAVSAYLFQEITSKMKDSL